MARLLLAWERGAGNGHATVLATLAQELLERGHEVHLAWKDLAACAELLGGWFGSPRLHLWQAPQAQARHAVPADPASYPELLQCVGFDDVDGLHARVLAWRQLAAAIGPDVVVADHAPTALLALRNGSAALAVIGSSFLVPPQVTPMPAFSDWQPVDAARLAAAESSVLAVCNRVLAATGRPALERLAELLRVDAVFRLGFAELDHCAGQRAPDEAPACGWPALSDRGSDPEWPQAEGPRIFAYLPRDHPALGAALERLRAAPAATLLCIADASDQEAAAAGGPRLRIVNRLVRMDRALAGAALLINHGGAGSTHAALRCGVPVLMLPVQTEQLLLARRVAAAGAGIFMWPQEVAGSFAAALTALLGSPGHAAAARRLAERNQAADSRSLMGRIAERCVALRPLSAPAR